MSIAAPTPDPLPLDELPAVFPLARLSRLLGMPTRQLRRWIDRDYLPAFRIGSRYYLRKADLRHSILFQPTP